MKRAAFPVLFALAIAALAAENALYFPLSVPYMKELAAGAPLLDIRLGYTPAAAYYLFDTLGDAGRAAYLRMLWEVDLVLPALFGIALFLAARREAFRQWRSIPLLATGCDYAENIAITVLLLRYPVQQPAVAQLASVFTVMKLVLYASGLVLYIAGFIVQRKKSFVEAFQSWRAASDRRCRQGNSRCMS